MDERELEPWQWTLEDVIHDMKADICYEHGHPEAGMDLRLMGIEFTFVDEITGEEYTDSISHEDFKDDDTQG